MASLLIGNGFHLNFVNGLNKNEYIKRLKNLIEKEVDFNKNTMKSVVNGGIPSLSLKDRSWPSQFYTKDGYSAVMNLLPIYIRILDNSSNFKIEDALEEVFMTHFLGIASQQHLVFSFLPRSYDIWKIFCAVVIWPFLTKSKSLDISNELEYIVQEKISRFTKVYTTNYTKYNLNIEALHGTIEDFSNIYISEFILSPSGKGKKEYIQFMTEKYLENKNVKDNLVQKMPSIAPYAKYSNTSNDDEISKIRNSYKNIQKGEKIEIFGLSPFGDLDLLNEIDQKFDKIDIYIYKLSENKAECDEFIRVFGKEKVKIFDSKNWL